MKRKTLSGMRENLRKDFILQNAIDRIEKPKPYVDPDAGMVFWGSDKGKKS